MKDEIKEILDNVKKCCDIMEDNNFVVYQKQDILKLLDYITNLQEENERLKIENKVLKEQMVAMVQPNYVYGLELRGVDKDEN